MGHLGNAPSAQHRYTSKTVRKQFFLKVNVHSLLTKSDRETEEGQGSRRHEAVSSQRAESMPGCHCWVPRPEHSSWYPGGIRGVDSRSVRLVLHVTHEGEKKGVHDTQVLSCLTQVLTIITQQYRQRWEGRNGRFLHTG